MDWKCIRWERSIFQQCWWWHQTQVAGDIQRRVYWSFTWICESWINGPFCEKAQRYSCELEDGASTRRSRSAVPQSIYKQSKPCCWSRAKCAATFDIGFTPAHHTSGGIWTIWQRYPRSNGQRVSEYTTNPPACNLSFLLFEIRDDSEPMPVKPGGYFDYRDPGCIENKISLTPFVRDEVLLPAKIRFEQCQYRVERLGNGQVKRLHTQVELLGPAWVSVREVPAWLHSQNAL